MNETFGLTWFIYCGADFSGLPLKGQVFYLWWFGFICFLAQKQWVGKDFQELVAYKSTFLGFFFLSQQIKLKGKKTWKRQRSHKPCNGWEVLLPGVPGWEVLPPGVCPEQQAQPLFSDQPPHREENKVSKAGGGKEQAFPSFPNLLPLTRFFTEQGYLARVLIWMVNRVLKDMTAKKSCYISPVPIKASFLSILL